MNNGANYQIRGARNCKLFAVFLRCFPRPLLKGPMKSAAIRKTHHLGELAGCVITGGKKCNGGFLATFVLKLLERRSLLAKSPVQRGCRHL